eukprot:gene20960-24914_t
MKIVSFLPAATKMIYDMGLQEHLYGVTFECPAEAAELPKIVRCVLEGKNYSSIEIDRIFSASKAQGKSLYWVDQDLLEEIGPDIIFTALGKEEVAFNYLARLRNTMDEILDRLRAAGAPLKRIMLMEWIEPIYNCGHWIPYQI